MSPTGLEPAVKARSCIVCRNRKVRCDRQTPCSHCRRANISCVYPSTDRPPRWVRRLDRFTEDSDQLSRKHPQHIDPSLDVAMDRLQNLENLVKELRAQLERAKSSTLVTNSGPATPSHDDADVVAPTSEPATHDSPASCGRLVGQDGAGESRYVGNAFWSRIAEEVRIIRQDSMCQVTLTGTAA
jgi:hypothetical protein